jgi:hypothetical protein
MITKEQIFRSMGYRTYRQLLDRLLEEGKTTGLDQSEEKKGFAKINIQRMQRLDKTVELNDDLKSSLDRIRKDYLLLVITEGWCGDTAQSVPLFNKIEEYCPRIRLRLILRDDNPDVMDEYLTNGSRSIPKLICFDMETLEEIFVWGPRPAPLQEKVTELLKTKPTTEEKGLMVQNWYNADKTQTIQAELKQLFDGKTGD